MFRCLRCLASDAAQLPQQLPGSFGRPSLPGAEGSAEGPGALHVLLLRKHHGRDTTLDAARHCDIAMQNGSGADRNCQKDLGHSVEPFLKTFKDLVLEDFLKIWSVVPVKGLVVGQ